MSDRKNAETKNPVAEKKEKIIGSKIGKQPILVPDAIKEIKIDKSKIKVTGPKGTLEWEYPKEIQADYKKDIKQIIVTIKNSDVNMLAKHGLTRAIIANMVKGVVTGFEKRLYLLGKNWNAKVEGRKLILNIGFNASIINIPLPEGIDVKAEPTKEISAPDKGNAFLLVVTGYDKQKVGQFAANLKSLRPPNPYTGKGFRYTDEFVRKKERKATAK